MMPQSNEPLVNGAPKVALARRLTLIGVVLFGLSYMAPSIVMQTFGIIATNSGGVAPLAYLLSMLAMTLTALSYGRLARMFPTSGSAYTYARRLLGGHAGFVVGWMILLDYFFLPIVAWLVQALYLNAQFPRLSVTGWLVVNAVATTIVNALGIAIADRVNRGLLALGTGVVLVFAVASIVYLTGQDSVGLTAPLWHSDVHLNAVFAAAAIAAYSYLGFDAVTTLSEETHDAARTIPRAVLLTVLIGGAFFTAVSYLMQLVHPGAVFDDPSTAGYALMLQVGGPTLANILNALQIVGGFAGCIIIQASASRLMYVMGRDGVLPRRFFGRLDPRFRTPLRNTVLIGVSALIGVKLSLETAASFINFGAFFAFTMVNVCVIVAYVRDRASKNVLTFVVLPLGGAGVTTYLLISLGTHAHILGVSWFAIGIVYLLVLTRAFTRKPPELSIDEVEGEPASPGR